MIERAWSRAQAEDYLLSLELFGMRFGLDRMHRLMTALGSPQHSFASIHVVGTNGKSSTVRMLAAILTRHGRRTGAYLSPHLISFAERVRVDDADLPDAAFAAAVQRAAHAAELVNRTLAPDDRVTQFEALTAAAYSQLAEHGVEVAVIEAGLGGRYDATNVIPSSVQVLTNVGLEHTRWLGPTVADIAREKLAVVRDGATLVVGELDTAADAEARHAAEHHGARLVRAPADPGVPVAARGGFQRRNFALAETAAEALLGELDERVVAEAAAAVEVPGRLQIVGRDPLTLFDGAHNVAGARALAAAVPEVAAAEGAHGDVVAVVSILEDKDAAAMLAELLPICSHAVFTAAENPRALPPGTLESLARQLAPGASAEVEPDPRAALARASVRAGAGGVVLATGSIYLVAQLSDERGERRASTL